MSEIIWCKRCVMNNQSDKTIRFDQNGYCNYCTNALSQIGKVYFPGNEGKRKLKMLLSKIKKDGAGKNYDCIMGLSGGLDSSYLAYLGYKWGLRVLAVHIDDGFDTEISKQNIKRLMNKTGFDYLTVVPDPEQFNALTKAYMKAGVANLAVPQDNVLFAFLYKKLKEYKIKYFLSGGNFALECILQKDNTFSAMDVVNIKDINKKYGGKPIHKLEFISNLQMEFDRRVMGIATCRPLNYIDYNKERAFKELNEFCGFEYYGSKHLENSLTAFIQLYWFPKKFGVDKRTSHLSSMIVSGQITRSEAMEILQQPLYDEEKMEEIITLIKNKIGLSDKEFKDIMNAPAREHTDFKSEKNLFIFKAAKFCHRFMK